MQAIPRYKLKVTIRKDGVGLYFSQLDLQRIYIRALRRAELPIWYSQGFSPHPKISYLNALKLGLAGTLDVVFWLLEPIRPQDFCARFNAVLPDGLRAETATYDASGARDEEAHDGDV
jgi:radical SAM-linked protein